MSDDAWALIYRAYMRNHVLPCLRDQIMYEPQGPPHDDDYQAKRGSLEFMLIHLFFYLDFVIEAYLPLRSWTIAGSVYIQIHVPLYIDDVVCRRCLDAGLAHYAHRPTRRIMHSMYKRSARHNIVEVCVQFCPFVSSTSHGVMEVQNLRVDAHPFCGDEWECTLYVNSRLDNRVIRNTKRNCVMKARGIWQPISRC